MTIRRQLRVVLGRGGGPVVPGHPRRGGDGGRRVVAKHGDEVLERRDAVELGSVDEAHEEVAHSRAVERLEEEGILPVEDGALERSGRIRALPTR